MPAVGDQRPDLAAYEQAVRLEAPVLAKELRELLGARLVAYLAGVSETRAVHQWATGSRRPHEEVGERLRLAYQVTHTLLHRDSPAVAQAWWQGLNPRLDDRSPARLVRDGDLAESGPAVLAAARAFAAGA